MHWSDFDIKMMKRALILARRGKAWVAPNPMVGAIVVRDGMIVGEGYHRRFGGPHAEVHALEDAGGRADGADLYVNLEPCAHYGKTPPCTQLIIERGIRRVVAATRDPNPKVNGLGFEQLRKAGIEVEIGLLEEEAKELNSPYLKKAETGRTWVTLKIAQSVDGRIACKTGHSRWITSKASRTYAHMMRAVHDAVVVGSGTVRSDDPMLNVRHVYGRNPVRIVLDTHFSIPSESKILNTPDVAPTWVFGAPNPDGSLPDWAENKGVRVIPIGQPGAAEVELDEFIGYISANGIMSLMVEGGSRVWTTFLKKQLVDKVEIVVAPIILGKGVDAIRDLGVLKVNEAVRLDHFHWRRIGSDLHIVARVLH